MQFRPDIGTLSPAVLSELAPGGVLRAGINLSNFLLVTGRTADGDPVGVSPDMARAVADNLGVAIRYVPYASPGLLADDATQDRWDIGLIGAEPQRAEVISFTPAYTEIEATYLVPAGSPLKRIADVDAEGIRIAVTGRAAYGLWLERNIAKAKLVRSDTLDEALKDFVDQKLDALAGLKPRLITDLQQVLGATMLEGHFMTVQQAIGTPKAKGAALDYLTKFVEAAKASGFVAGLISKHGVDGLSVAS
ncbi:ABC transporter substrate-binding protein [Bosea caraganae]|uniref:ABC transporter substrate-binding protein n=1 Tax=Bosea caraganae TaxID=2763117 RepID=A0A370L1G5_9HYPH|nr:transporter substrate-binding domain-containing protein [Bosea caraganae]RDJ21409.1 ABC transporter substrate-binding protein [Bosea caraganae]RDJ23377.1 ABC transporter substrate-binding protein [Bosea caraganae]